jgi:putative transposase
VARTRGVQLELPLRTWGGARPGAGRKPNARVAGVSHLKRPHHDSRHPVHVTWRVRDEVPGLRGRAFRAVRRAFVEARERLGARIVEFSVQSNHIHLIIEARDRASMSASLKGLAVRLARALNRLRDRTGAVFADRYHARALRTPLEVKRALAYVLCNVRKHAAQRGVPLPAGWMDARSSAAWFDGWAEPNAAERSLGLSRAWLRDERPVALPRTWLLRVGWRRHGLLDADAQPG